MPELFYEPLDRRSFLRTTALAGVALAITGCRTNGQPGAEACYRMALLSDTHVPGDRVNGHRGFNPFENLKRIVPEVQAARPEGVLLCGDAARLEGLPEDYAAVRELLQPIAAETPIYIGLGNHDDRANFRKAFPARKGTAAKLANKHVLVVESAPVRIILLDSLMYPNKVEGLLGQAQRTWVAEYLNAHRDRPAVLFVHHTLGDRDGDLLDTQRLFEIADRYAHVKAIFFGHSHVWSRERRNRLHLVNLPAVGYNFRDTDPMGWVDAHFHRDGVDLTMHAFAGNRADDGKVFPLGWS